MPRRPRRNAKTSDKAEDAQTLVAPAANASVSSTVNTTTSPTLAAGNESQQRAGIDPNQAGSAGVGDAAPSSRVDNDGDVITRPTSDSIAAIANATKPAAVINNAQATALVPTSNPHAYRCNVCNAEFPSMSAMTEHLRTSHRDEPSTLLATPVINAAIQAFLQAWDGLRLLAPDVSSEALSKYLDSTVDSSPDLIVEDQGLCTSFMLIDNVPASHLSPELIGFTWFMQMYQMTPPLPEGAVNRIVCMTNWASLGDPSRGIEVRLPPPTDNTVHAYKTVLSQGYVASSQFSPLTFRANTLLMLTQFVLSNLKINKSSTFTSDVTTLTVGRMICSFEARPELLALAYPGRAVLPVNTKNAQFLATAIPDRIGRIDRANLIGGEVSASVECMELCDSLTLYIRENYLMLLRSMHQDPTRIVQIVNECARNLLNSSIPVNLRPSILCPWFASTADLRLQQAIHLVNISSNTAAALPQVEALSSLLRSVTPLVLNPTILTNAITTISESTTQTISPISEILRLLSPTGNDYAAFWKCIASWAYNGLVQTVLSEDAFPDSSQSITHLPSMWKCMLLTLAAPMTSDPHSPVKVFMSLANLLAQPEPIVINVDGMHQTTPASQFSHPGVWPPGFINPAQIPVAQAPLLRAFADHIHANWPQPSDFEYGSAAQGSGNLFIPPNRMVYPWPNAPLPRMTVAATFDSAMSQWISTTIAFFIRVVNAPIMAPTVNDLTRRTITGVLTAMRQVKTMTPFYIQHMCPTELAVLGSITLVPPFQVPFTRLVQNDAITNVLVARVDPTQRGDAAVDIRATHATFSAALPVDPASIVVAMLCGQTPTNLIPSHHYGKAFAPLFTSNAMFTRNQRAVITREALVCARSIVAQCQDDGFNVPRPLAGLRQFDITSAAAAEIWHAVNDAFKTAFDIDGALLDGMGLYGDPRIADISVAYLQYDGRVTREHVPPDQSFIHRALLTTENTFLAEMNLFNVGAGDIFLIQTPTNGNWAPMVPVAHPPFARGGPNVNVVGNHGTLAMRPNGLEPQLIDNAGVPRDIAGDWIYPIDVLQVSVSTFRDYVWPLVVAGRVRVRIEIPHYVYTTHYHQPQTTFTDAQLVETWLAGIDPTGIPPIPFSIPIPQVGACITSRRVYHVFAAQNNNNSLFSTNSSSIATVFGEDAGVSPARWPALVDPNYQFGTNELPNRITLYGSLFRYNFTYPSLSGVMFMRSAE
ncbi:VP3 [American grass carp reovirus]|uniref:Inner capsid protein VP3 n=1 Tax=Aquareovirus G (isolate American grass carp/USA/PB01-155/-) TaxID=648234 RepID=CAPSD_AQRVG|nr:VP3 [American grass carp reovirus]B2BNE1.1 RecName: Full=Major inner capsid protein VP3; AltName: Full=ATP-dependent DNA helicase VP3 [American grass carp reovirus PB01-155]ABV01041.1 VP3 [American grass carp reovirus]